MTIPFGTRRRVLRVGGGQLTTTVTVVPPGLNTRWTCIFPGPSAATLTVVVAWSASVPDIGETTTFLVRPGGSETDQSTGPPEAESVIVPVADGVTSRVAGRTLSVPEADVALTVADAGAGVDVTAVALGDGLPPVVAALTLAVPPVPLAASSTLLRVPVATADEVGRAPALVGERESCATRSESERRSPLSTG